MFKKYRWNFFFLVFSVSIVGFIIFDLLIYFSLRSYLFNQIFEDNRMKANLAKIILEEKLPQQMSPQNDELWKLTAQIKKIVDSRVTIIDESGTVLTDSDVPRDEIFSVESHLQRPEVQKALQNGWGQSYRTSATINKKLFYSAIRIDWNNQVLGFLRFAYYAKNFEASMKKVLLYIILANLIGLFVVAFAAYYLGSVVTYPLLRVIKTAQKIAEGNLDKSFAVKSRDEIGRLSSILNELTQKLKTQIQQINYERQKLSNILNRLSAGVIAINKNGEIFQANKSLEEMFELNFSELLSKRFDQIDLFKPLRNDVNAALKENLEKKGEFNFYQKGYKKFISYRINPTLFPGDDQNGVLIQLNDITELKQLEAIRKNFVASASHELKTPLTAIIGYAETLKEGAIEKPEAAVRFLHRILEQAHKLESLVSDLLKLSQLEHDMPLALSEINLKEIIEAVTEEFAQKAKQKQIKIIKKFSRQSLQTRADKKLILTALENLVDNAIKYTSAGGSVTITAVLIDEEKIKISVKDTGIGIHPKYHQRIFQRFYRVDKARSREMGGTGLGLAIVKHIIERHGSQIHVESEPGKGSCFYFELKQI